VPRPFWSEDVIGLRLCGDVLGCRENEDRFAHGERGGSYKPLPRLRERCSGTRPA